MKPDPQEISPQKALEMAEGDLTGTVGATIQMAW